MNAEKDTADRLREKVIELLDDSRSFTLRWLETLIADPSSKILEDFIATEENYVIPKTFFVGACEREASSAGYGPSTHYDTLTKRREIRRRIRRYQNKTPGF